MRAKEKEVEGELTEETEGKAKGTGVEEKREEKG